MNYTQDINNLMSQLNKSISQNNRLNYFKTELLKVLDKKEAHENQLSKAIDSYFNSMAKSLLNEFGIEKGKVATIGEIRTWKDGKKYKKMPNGNWVRVYQSQDRSAEISIARLKGKVRNATSTDELLKIVMANVHRFEDENGKILPIVEELKKEVASSKGRLNAGKPSTQQQIETFKQNQAKNKKYMPKYIFDTSHYFESTVADYVHPNQLKVGDKFLGSGWNTTFGRKILTVTDIEIENRNRTTKYYKFKDQDGEIHVYAVGEYGHSNVAKIKDDYNFEQSALDKIADEYESAIRIADAQEKYKKLNEMQDELSKYIQQLRDEDKKYAELRSAEKIKEALHIQIQGAYWMLPEQIEKKKKIEAEADKIEETFLEKRKNIELMTDYDEKHDARLALIKEIKKQIKENEKKINEIDNNTASYPFTSLNYQLDRMIDRLKRNNEKENELRPSIKNASNDLMNGKKEYTAEQKENARIECEKIKKVFVNYRKNLKEVNDKIKDKNHQWMSLRWSADEETQKQVRMELKDLEFERDTIFTNVKAYSKMLDEHLEVILDDIIDTPVQHDETIDYLETADGCSDYMKSKGYFNESAIAGSDLDNVDPKLAKKVVNMFEKFFTVVDLKGQLSGTTCNAIGKNTYAQVHWGSTKVEMNRLWFNNDDKFVNQFNADIASGFHPDTPPESIMIHELTHSMVNHIGVPGFMDLAKVIKEKVMKQYKIKGMKPKDVIRKYVSGYATKNADEFCAEAFVNAIVGKNKNNLCRAVAKEFIKATNYLGGLYA